MANNAEDSRLSQEDENLRQEYGEYLRTRTELEEFNPVQNNKCKYGCIYICVCMYMSV